MFKKNGGGFRTLSFVWDGSENKIMVFNNKNNNLNLWIAYYFSFMVHLFIRFLTHLYWFYFRCIFSNNLYGPVDVCLLEVGILDLTTKIMGQRKAFYTQRIPESSCARKETVNIGILVTSRNGNRKILQSIRITSRLPSIKRKRNQLSHF